MLIFYQPRTEVDGVLLERPMTSSGLLQADDQDGSINVCCKEKNITIA